MRRKGIFIAATGQNVGKTTISLGLIAALKKRVARLGVMKPVGQVFEKTSTGHLADKDVVLFKEYFELRASYEEMSPVLFPAGFTRDFLDGKVDGQHLKNNILQCYAKITAHNDYTVVEGTGHVGVGSIVGLNNADVASALGLDVILIAKGGVGSAFDELALNKSLLDARNVRVRGVILNKVRAEKRSMIMDYTTKALSRWNIPLIGCIPYNELLGTPSMEDFELLFKTKMIAGQKHLTMHFPSIRLVATSMEKFREITFPNQLIVTPASRVDIVDTLLDVTKKGGVPENGLILTGRYPPSQAMIEKLQKADIPTLYAAKSSYEAMQMIASFTAKIHIDDTSKIEKAIQLVENYIDFSNVIIT